MVSPSASRVEPGGSLDVTVTVESTWPDSVAAGFLLMTKEGGGVFTSSEDGVDNVGVTEGLALEYAIGHTQARELADSMAIFTANWTAPATVGAYEFAVFAVTSDDGDGMDDAEIAEESNEPVGRLRFTIGVGCDLTTYYLDSDSDGYGADEILSCDAPEGYVAQNGDCKDDNPAVNPGAEEKCSFTDENCDGEAMAPPTFYRDADGDGYGAASELLVDTCDLPEGYAAAAGDCATNDPAVHPGAEELPNNGVDDNCDGVIDEVSANPQPAPPVSAGEVVSNASESTTSRTSTEPEPSSVLPATTSTASSPAGQTDPAGSGGCHVVGFKRTSPATVLFALLGVAGLRRRKSTSSQKYRNGATRVAT